MLYHQASDSKPKFITAHSGVGDRRQELTRRLHLESRAIQPSQVPVSRHEQVHLGHLREHDEKVVVRVRSDRRRWGWWIVHDLRHFPHQHDKLVGIVNAQVPSEFRPREHCFQFVQEHRGDDEPVPARSCGDQQLSGHSLVGRDRSDENVRVSEDPKPFTRLASGGCDAPVAPNALRPLPCSGRRPHQGRSLA